MKVVFVGPSLPDVKALADATIDVQPPAIQGDLLKAVQRGATVIGLIDGGFEYTAPVWHKEILHALSEGVTVFGAASMGALRAAECESFGMIGVGDIFRGYASGQLVDDADVALLHGPVELGSPALSLPMVNVRATLAFLCENGKMSRSDGAAVLRAADSIFFKDRTWSRVAAACDIGIAPLDLERALRSGYVDQKRLDAIALLALINQHSAGRTPPPRDWQFHETTIWQEMRRHL